MTHPVLRTSTALGLSLSLLQPGIAPAQAAAIDPAFCAESAGTEACTALPESVLDQTLEEPEAAEPAAPGAGPVRRRPRSAWAA